MEIDRIDPVSLPEAERRQRQHPLSDSHMYLCLVVAIGMLVVLAVGCAQAPVAEEHTYARPSHERL
jgi:hypothetical protein